MSEFNTIQDALKHYDLDFDISLVPLFIYVNSDEQDPYKEVPFKKAVIRTDTNYPLGVVGDKYTLAPLRDVLASLQPLVDDGSITISRFYSENNGARVSCCFKLSNSFTEYGGFLADTEFNVRLSHDGSSKGIVSLLGRAENGNVYPFGDEYSLSFKHTKGSVVKITNLEKVLTIVKNDWKEFEEYVRLGSTEPVTDDEAKEYLDTYMHINNETKQGENTLEAILKRWHHTIFPSMRNTIFGLYVSVCDWAQEEKSIRITSKRKKQAGDSEIVLSDIRTVNLLKNPQIYKAWAGVKTFSNVSVSLR